MKGKRQCMSPSVIDLSFVYYLVLHLSIYFLVFIYLLFGLIFTICQLILNRCSSALILPHAISPSTLFSLLFSSSFPQAGGGSALQVFALRLGPGEELFSSLLSFVEERKLRAPFIITCVGSVTKATLRLANATAENTNEVNWLESGVYFG